MDSAESPHTGAGRDQPPDARRVAVDRGWLSGGSVSRSEAEFRPLANVSVSDVVNGYRARATATDEAVRRLDLEKICALDTTVNLRWVLLHLINETARHAGHADATRELLDGVSGE